MHRHRVLLSLDIFGLKFYVQLVRMRLLASLYGAFVGADILQCKNNQCRVIKIRVENQNFLSKGFFLPILHRF